ncbi:hypothetical protein PMAYCL1PPCAC_07502, partial [Pristionchus mayeri]
MSSNDSRKEYSPELTEMGEEEKCTVLKRRSSSASMEDDEKTDKPSRKKNKAGIVRFGRWDSENSQDEMEDGEVFEKTEEIKKEEHDDDNDVQVICEIPRGEAKIQSKPQRKCTPSTDELARANERIFELERELEISKGVVCEVEQVKKKATQLEGLLDEAIKKTRVAESHADAAEKSLAASKPVESSWKWLSGERLAKIREHNAEISSMKEKMKADD